MSGSDKNSSPAPLRRFFYGWWIVLGSTITPVFSCGIGFCSHGALLDPLRIHYGWSKGTAVLFMARFHQVAVLYLGTFAFGLTMGGIVMMQSLLVGDCFGMASFGTIIGFSGLFTQVGASFGPTIAGLIFDATRDYRTAFTIFGMASLSAMVAVFFARPPKVLRGVPVYTGTR